MPRHRGRLRRSRDARLIGGVAEGLSKRIGIDVTIIRVGLVLFGLASGTGVAAYVLAWLFVPVEGEDENIAQRALEDRRGIALVLGLVPVLVAVFILGAVIGVGWIGSAVWAGGISLGGLILIWRNAPDEERAVLERLAQPVIQLAVPEGRSWTRISVRAALGAALLAGGLVALLAGHPSHVLVRSLGGVILVIAAFVVMFGPWWLGRGARSRRSSVRRGRWQKSARTWRREFTTRFFRPLRSSSGAPTILSRSRSSLVHRNATCAPGCSAEELRAPPTGTIRRSGPPSSGYSARWRLITESRSRSSRSATASSTTTSASFSPRPERRPSTRPSGQMRTWSRCSQRSSRRRCRCSCVTAERGSTRQRCLPTAKVSLSPSTGG